MMKHWQINPIMVKEFRSRMRGWRAFAILTVYLLLMALFSYGLYRIILLSPPYGTPLSPMIGQSLYAAIANLSMFFVVFLMPALTATAISSEQEKLTLEMLLATPLSAHSVLIGKLVASAGYIILLLFAAIPMISLVFIFGGVTLPDLLLVTLMILATAITVGMVGLFFSAWRKRTIQAIVLSYMTVLILIIGTYVVYIFWSILIQDFAPRYILMANPFSGLASALAGGRVNDSPMMLFGLLSGWGRFMDDPDKVDQVRALWHYTLAFDIGLTGLLYLLSSRFIQPVRRWRIGWPGLAGAAVIAILYLGIVTAIFYPDIQTEQELRRATPTPVPAPVPMAPAPVVPPPLEQRDAAGPDDSPLPTPTPTDAGGA